MTELKADKVAYTINKDGTLEKWYVERVLYEEQVILRKQPRPKWHDIIRGFKPEDVFATAKEAKAAQRVKQGDVTAAHKIKERSSNNVQKDS